MSRPTSVRSPASKTVRKQQLVSVYKQAVAAGIPLETVQQKIQTFADRFHFAVTVEDQDDHQRIKKLQRQVPLKTRLIAHALPVLLVATGLFALSTAIWPILSYFLFTSPQLLSGTLKAPVPNSMIMDPLVQSIQAQASVTHIASPEPSIEPIIMADDLDFANLNNWFPNMTKDQAEQLNRAQQPQNGSGEYTLDIPAVNITTAHVKIGGTNLDKSLIQYPGTAMPGEPGAAVIFGHSVLRQFYNPAETNPRRYTSIFSKIMTLTPGDKVYLTRDGIKYTYVVDAKTEVKPEDTYILEQNFENKILKLVTCVPEGTYLRRGVVIARLVQE